MAATSAAAQAHFCRSPTLASPGPSKTNTDTKSEKSEPTSDQEAEVKTEQQDVVEIVDTPTPPPIEESQDPEQDPVPPQIQGAPESDQESIPVEFLPRGLSYEHVANRQYVEYKRGYLRNGEYQRKNDQHFNDPPSSEAGASNHSQVRGRRAGIHNKVNRLLRLTASILNKMAGDQVSKDKRTNQLKHAREAAKKLEQSLQTEGGMFDGKQPERVLGFIVYGEEIAAGYVVASKPPSHGADMLEEDVVSMYVYNLGGDARRWAREAAISTPALFKDLDLFKDALIERYLGETNRFDEFKMLDAIKQYEKEAVDAFASRVQLGAMYATRRTMMGEAKLTREILAGAGFHPNLLKFTDFMTPAYLTNMKNAISSESDNTESNKYAKLRRLPFAYFPLEPFYPEKRSNDGKAVSMVKQGRPASEGGKYLLTEETIDYARVKYDTDFGTPDDNIFVKPLEHEPQKWPMMNIYSIRRIEPSENTHRVKMTMGSNYHCSEGNSYITDKYLNGGKIGNETKAYLNVFNNAPPQDTLLKEAYTELVFPLLPADKYYLGDKDTDVAEKFAQRVKNSFNKTADATSLTNGKFAPDENFFINRFNPQNQDFEIIWNINNKGNEGTLMMHARSMAAGAMCIAYKNFVNRTLVTFINNTRKEISVYLKENIKKVHTLDQALAVAKTFEMAHGKGSTTFSLMAVDSQLRPEGGNFGVSRVEELQAQIYQLQKEIQESEEDQIGFEAPGQMISSATWRDRPPTGVVRGRGAPRGQFRGSSGSFRGSPIGRLQESQPPRGANAYRGRGGGQQNREEKGPCFICRGKHLARECIYKDSHQTLSDGRMRYKRNIVRKINNIKVPTLMWYYPDEGVAEDILEYDEQEEDYSRDLDEEEVTILHRESAVNQVQLNNERIDFPSQWKDYVKT